MYSDVVIDVQNVSKCFEIYPRPQDRLRQFVMPRVRQTLKRAPRNYHQEFWALHDVSFRVERGQAVGIIGQNGSGKSTLLQIITGTMTPTGGTVNTDGRIAALLELGSGFNPEFTGRENVYLNARLLGLSRAQTDDKFDIIAGFADIGDFLDQPVKTYSSGMMVRLAFAVQVAVETEILIIDEALAVGDARFQLKCFRRLDELKAKGTTILFVSHSTEMVRSFCDHGLLLNHGRALYWGDAKTATIKYMQLLFPERQPVAEVAVPDEPPAPAAALAPLTPVKHDGILHFQPADFKGQIFGEGGANLEWLTITGIDDPNILPGKNTITIKGRYNWDIGLATQLASAGGYNPDITFSAALADRRGVYLFGCNGFDYGLPVDCRVDGTATIELTIDLPYVTPGDYFLTIAIALGSHDHHVQLRWYDAITQLHSVKADKHVYGTFAIDYTMKRIA